MRHTLLLSAAVLAAATFATNLRAAPAAAPIQAALADEKDDEHKGEKKDLGKKKIGDHEVQVTQVGDVVPGKEAIFIIKVTGGSAKPKAIRGWIGIETGKGSIKSQAEDEKTEYHLHHEVSKPLPAKNALWVELDTTSGKKVGSFDYSPHDAKKHEHAEK